MTGLALIAGGVGAYLVTREPVRVVKIRWSDTVPATQRGGVARDLALRACRPESDNDPTELCDLLIWTPEQLAAIVQHPAIADTSGFDRGTLTFPPAPRLGTSYTWVADRYRLFRDETRLHVAGVAALLLVVIGIALQPAARRMGAAHELGHRVRGVHALVAHANARPYVLGIGGASVAAAIASVPLFLHAHTALYSRFLADDYCSAVAVDSRGVIGMTVEQYLTWSGRYTAHALDGLVTSLGPIYSAVVPGVSLVLFVSGLTVYFSRELLRALPLPARVAASLALACLAMTTTLFVTPDPLESLYWGQGMRTVMPGLLIGVALAVLLGTQSPWRERRWGDPVCALLAFLACGVGETNAAVQSATLTLVTAWTWQQRRAAVATASSDRGWARLLWTLGGSLLGSVVVVASPGNAVRESYFRHPSIPWELLRVDAIATAGFLHRVFMDNAAAIGGVFAASLLISIASPRRRSTDRVAWEDIAWLTGGALLVLFAAFLPAAYGLSGPPPPRTQIVPTFVAVLAVAMLGHRVGFSVLSRPLPRIVTTLLAVACLGWIAVNTRTFTNEVRTRAGIVIADSVVWDEVDAKIRAAKAAGATLVTIPAKQDNWAGLETVGPDPRFWVNGCVGQYYGVEVVAR